MKIRKLKLKDASLMLEWMHDPEIVEFMIKDFLGKNLSDCEEFIKASREDKNNIFLAIASDEDEYMGTVSLKNVDRNTQSAELSVVVRKEAMTKGYSWFGVEEILHKAFEDYSLECVYWCVRRSDKRSIRFYDKHNFHEVLDVLPCIRKRYRGIQNLKWYSFLKGDAINAREEVAGCKIIHIKTIPTVGAGELSFFEGTHEVPFDFKRVYYISKVPEGTRRGFHAHKTLKQLLFCPYGRIQMILENKNCREEIELSDPSIGVVIDKPTWREMLWLQKDSVLCVASSEFYDENDYIRNYEDFKEYINVEI